MPNLWPEVDLRPVTDSPAQIFDEGRDELETLTGGRLTLEFYSTPSGPRVNQSCAVLARHLLYRYPLFHAEWDLGNPYPVELTSDLSPVPTTAGTPATLRETLRRLFASPTVVGVVKQLSTMTS